MREADVEAAQALADVATIAILQHRASLEAQVVNQQLQHALNSRIVIEQAKGMVAEREGLNMEQAFSALRTHARNHNLRLVDFKNTVIIMTSNLGTADLRKTSVGFAKTDEAVTHENMKVKVNDALKQHFRPEFLNRIDRPNLSSFTSLQGRGHGDHRPDDAAGPWPARGAGPQH